MTLIYRFKDAISLLATKIVSGKKVLLGTAILAWVGLVTTGFVLWEIYDRTPGKSEEPEAIEKRSPGKWEAVMYLHPHCPCSRNSLRELSELTHQAGTQLGIRILFIRPEGCVPGWERTSLWDIAAAIPGAEVDCDNGGKEARKNGVRTSGHLIISDPQGRVAFYGGITRGRGLSGESSSRRTILALLAGEEAQPFHPGVFGCDLFDSVTEDVGGK